jgi:hypothetical protein
MFMDEALRNLPVIFSTGYNILFDRTGDIIVGKTLRHLPVNFSTGINIWFVRTEAKFLSEAFYSYP